MSEKDPFSLIKIYLRFGAIRGEYIDGKIRTSLEYHLRFFICILILFGLSLKTAITFMFDKNDEIQWFIGDWFNIFDNGSRFWINICSIFAGSSLSIQHVFFRWLNGSKENQLIYWMKCFHIIKSENQLFIGLPKKETELFWTEQIKLNEKLDKFSSYFIIFSGLSITYAVIFSTKFKISLFNYILFGLIHGTHNFLYCYVLLSIFINSNFYQISICKFFEKKFKFLNSKIENLNKEKVDYKYNQKLKRLIWQFNYVIMELIKTNQYFKYYFGSYFIVLIIFSLLLGLVTFLNINIMTRFVAFEGLISVLLFIIIFPYYQSNKILIIMEDICAKLQKISFKSNVSLNNKVQINYISYYLRDKKIGFSCFDLFTLNNYDSLIICLTLFSYILMILKVTHVLN